MSYLSIISTPFSCLTTHATEQSLCSSVLGSQNEHLFIEAIITLAKAEALNTKEVTEIAEEPQRILEIIKTVKTQTVAFFNLFETILESGINSEIVREALQNYLNSKDSLNTDRTINLTRSKDILDLTEIEHQDSFSVKEKNLVRIKWKGREAIILSDSGFNGRRYPGNQIVIFDPISGTVLDRVTLRLSVPHLGLYSHLLRALDVVQTDSRTLLLVSVEVASIDFLGNSKTRNYLYLVDLNTGESIRRVLLLDKPKAFRFYKTERSLIALGTVISERKLRIFEIEPKFKFREVKLQMNPILDRIEYLRQATFLHKNELHIALMGEDWPYHYQVVNIEQARVVLTTRFPQKRGLGPPFVIEFDSDTKLVFVGCRTGEACLFDPMNPAGAFEINEFTSNLPWNQNHSLISEEDEKRFIGSTTKGLVALDLSDKTQFESLSTRSALALSRQITDWFLHWNTGLRKDVMTMEKMNMPFTQISEQFYDAPNMWKLKHKGDWFLVIGREGFASPSGKSLSLIDLSDGKAIANIPLRKENQRRRPIEWPLSGEWFYHNGDTFLVIVDTRLAKIRTIRVITQGGARSQPKNTH